MVCGCLCWGSAVAFGLGALLTASELAFTSLKVAGALYLFWLGLHLLLRPRREFPVPPSDPARGAGSWFWRGLCQNLLNPKVGVFYISFLPQFVPAGVGLTLYALLLAAIHATLGIAWLAALVLATRPLVRMLRRPAVIRMIDRLTGAVFLGFGLRLALARR